MNAPHLRLSSLEEALTTLEVGGAASGSIAKWKEPPCRSVSYDHDGGKVGLVVHNVGIEVVHLHVAWAIETQAERDDVTTAVIEVSRTADRDLELPPDQPEKEGVLSQHPCVRMVEP